MRAAVRAASIQYKVVLVVVCLPEFRAREISAVSTLAVGTSKLVKLLLPEPDGPSTKVFLPSSKAINLSVCVVSTALSSSGLIASGSIW